jgi:hypothetical protein
MVNRDRIVACDAKGGSERFAHIGVTHFSVSTIPEMRLASDAWNEVSRTVAINCPRQGNKPLNVNCKQVDTVKIPTKVRPQVYSLLRFQRNTLLKRFDSFRFSRREL